MCSCFHSLELSFVSSVTEWKATGSFCKQVQQYIKGEQSTHKLKNLNEWCMAFTETEKRIETVGHQWGELWRKAEIDRTDRHAAEWERLIDNLPLSHHVAPIRTPSLISLQRTYVSLQLRSSAQLSSDRQTSVLYDFCLSSISPPSPPSPLRHSLWQSYSLHRIWLQGFRPCSPEPLRG